MLAKKCLFMGIFTLLSLSLAIADPPAVHPTTGEPLVIDCLRGTPYAIDGDLSDWNLGAMTPAVLDAQEQLSDDSSDKANWDSPEDSSGEFYLLWDDENIYIAVVMKDDKLSMNKTGDSIWNADCIETFFSTTNFCPDCSEHYQYGFNANDQRYNWCNMDGNGSIEPDYLQIASSETADGYICEVSIEYGQMLSLDFSVGNTIGFHPVFDDTDNGDREIQMTWTGRIAHDQSLGYGHIFLSDVAISGGNVLARRPKPADGVMLTDIWANLEWVPGPTAVSHDVYLGDNFDDVNDGTPETFIGNQAVASLLIGFPGFPVPDGLVPGTTYYWRIDEVNDLDPNSPWKGKVWSFSIQPYTAYNPDPADGAESVDLNVELNWTGGFNAKLHTVYFGENFDDVNNATEGVAQGITTYTPGPLKLSKTYYWRVDEFDAFATHKGDVWSFTTEGAVGNPNPSNGAVDVEQTPVLTWTPGVYAASHQVYFGTDKDAVRNANTGSPEYKGTGNLGSESYNPGKLQWYSTYYWRIDEANNVNPDSPWKGSLWSFTTADFIVIDDFEDYNDYPPDEIFSTWIDGWEVPTNGSMAGHPDPPFAETSNVHGGGQSMPLYYDNNFMYSEATMTLTQRNWTEEDVGELSLWFRGNSDNAAERMYVALNGSAVVYHDDPAATQLTGWKEWVIDLTRFADQGVNLANVNTISIGFGDKNNLQAGGSGMVLFDDIRLYRPAPEPEPDEIVNILTNGGFEDGVLEPWGFWGDATAEVITELVGAAVPDAPIEGGSCLHITVNSAGANDWDYGLNQGGHVFEAGKQYTVSAFLKCNQGTLDIRLKPERGADPWEGYGEQVFTMTEEWTEYSVTTPVFTEDVNPASITFHIAFAAGDFWVDDVRFVEVE